MQIKTKVFNALPTLKKNCSQNLSATDPLQGHQLKNFCSLSSLEVKITRDNLEEMSPIQI